MERDWASTLLPASWNGLPFYVESDGTTAGARLPTTDIPNGGWVTECFGRKRREFKITAYLATEGIEAAGEALLRASESGRPGILVLPMGGFILARVKEAKRNFKKDQLGYLAFDLEAQEEWPETGGLTINAARSALYALTAAIVVPLALGVASRLMSAMTSAAPRERAIEQGGAALSRLAALRDSARPDTVARAAINAGLVSAAKALPSLPTTPGVFATAFLTASQILGESADPASVQAALANEVPPAPLWAPKWAPTGARGAEVDQAFTILIHAGLALAMAEAVSRREFSARPEAVMARSAVSSAISRARDLLSGPEGEAGNLLAALDAAMATYLTRIAADLAPLVHVSAGATLPALWWSWYLHGDVVQASEIVARAKAPHPGFMPITFQTVAPDAFA